MVSILILELKTIYGMKSIFNKHNTDKSRKHQYEKVYEKYFLPSKEKDINLLEVGTFRGASTAAFHEYFPFGNIYTIDIFERVNENDIQILNEDRVFYLKQNSTLEGVTSMVEESWPGVKFDFIIDDGAHYPLANALTLKNLMPFLKDTGIYFIEDYWPLDMMTKKELSNQWLVDRPEKYNQKDQKVLLNELSKYNVEHYDHRGLTNNADSYILKITK